MLCPVFAGQLAHAGVIYVRRIGYDQVIAFGGKRRDMDKPADACSLRRTQHIGSTGDIARLKTRCVGYVDHASDMSAAG